MSEEEAITKPVAFWEISIVMLFWIAVGVLVGMMLNE